MTLRRNSNRPSPTVETSPRSRRRRFSRGRGAVAAVLVAGLGAVFAAGCSSSSPSVVEINWMVGLGTGFDLSLIHI